MAALTRLVAHGGWQFALVETGLLVVLAAFVGWIWLRERGRRLRKESRHARMRE